MTPQKSDFTAWCDRASTKNPRAGMRMMRRFWRKVYQGLPAVVITRKNMFDVDNWFTAEIPQISWFMIQNFNLPLAVDLPQLKRISDYRGLEWRAMKYQKREYVDL